MLKYYWSVGLLTLGWDANICESVLNCPTDILKHAWNQPWYSFSLQWGGKETFYPYFVGWAVPFRASCENFFMNSFSCVSMANLRYGWCEELWSKTFLHLNLSYVGVIHLLCTLCVKEGDEDDEEVTDDYLRLVTTQIWLFDNVCCSFRIFFLSVQFFQLRLKPFL